MPTKKPRILITLEQRSYDVLKSISETSGRPMSSFVSELLEGAMPTLERMAVTFQKIKQAQDSERATFLAAVDDAQSVIEPVVMEAIGQFDLFMGRVDAAADAVSAKGGPRLRGVPSAASAAVPVPRTNRGVTPTQPKRPQPNSGKALKVVSKNEVSKKSSAPNEHNPKAETARIKAKVSREMGLESDAAEHEAYAKQIDRKEGK